MKLLVYGGTEHNIRCRIGNWELAAQAPLSDLYSVPEDAWAIGLGILQAEPFLFLKRRQITGGRVYPFTILFSPPRPVWQKFGWNAAHLAISLIGEKSPFRADLLEKPESFGVRQLEEMTDALSAFSIDPRPSAISAAVAGSLFEPEMIAVSPAQLDSPFPAIIELAESLEAIPSFARSGNGWLFGGSRENAKYLGINLVFDNNLQNPDEQVIERLLKKGETFLDHWQTIAEKQSLQPILRQFQDFPARLWETELRQSPPEFFSAVGELGELYKSEAISDEQLERYRRQDGVFGAEIYREALHLACRAQRALTPERTAFLLQNVQSGDLPATDLPAEFLERSVIVNWLIERRKFPSESDVKFNFTSFERFEICREITGRENELKKIPDLFAASVKELELAGDATVEDYVPHLAQIVRDKTSADLWEIWSGYYKKDFFKEYLAGTFAAQARELTKAQKDNNWVNVYLRFADDRGGRWLAENVPPQTAKAFIQSALQVSDSSEVTAWFRELKSSPLRSQLSNEEKEKIAFLNGELMEEWKNFIVLMNLLKGAAAPIEKIESTEEKTFLENELAEFLRANPDASLSKLKAPLKKFFGELPTAFADESNRRGEEKSQKKNGKPATVNQPEKSVLETRAIGEAAEKVSRISQMICQGLAKETTRQVLLRDFWNPDKSFLQGVFPYLTLPVRVLILSWLFRENANEAAANATRLFKENEDGQFSVALWECLLLSETGKEVRSKMSSRIGEGRDLPGELYRLVQTSVENESRSFLPAEPEEQKEDLQVSDGEGDAAGIFKRYFNWLFGQSQK